MLGKRTVIYGRNGSGKTTMSEALRQAAATGTADSSVIKARLVDSGTVTTIELGPATMPFQLFVYNRYYVHESLRLFLDGDGEALPILKLGAQNVRAAGEIREMQQYIGMLEVRQKSLAAAVKRIESGRETIEKQTKADIIAALASADSAYYNSTRYQVTLVRHRLNDQAGAILTDEALAVEQAAATATTLYPITGLGAVPGVGATLHTTINDELLGAAVESVQLPRLAADRTLSEWVEQGLAFHEEGDLCAFCQVGRVSGAVLAAYHQHFSAALEILRDRLTKAISYLESQIAALTEWKKELPKDEQFLPDFRERASGARKKLEGELEALVGALERALAAVRARLADPLNVVAESDRLEGAFPMVDPGPICELIDSNNEASSSQTERIKQAKAAVEAHYGAVGGDEYRRLAARIARATRASSALTSRQAEVDERLRELQQSQQDVGRMANLIDADLRNHFGHAHLRVTVSADGKGYVVLRAGEAAARLSEGERNAIAFAYFLRSLEAEGVDPARSVVVIDDPVTSLDKEALFAAFALAEARTEPMAQTIVLTHDYEYFRLQLMEYASKWNSSQKRIKRESEPEEKLMPTVSLLEMRTIAPVEGGSRRGEMRQMPRSLIQHPSEYHFLFLHVAEAVLGQSREYLPLVGNAGRRLLEGFLSFRAPSRVNFQEKVDAVASAASIDPSLKERVVKFLHSQSHREEPRPSAALDFPSIEAELVAALSFIYQADRPHFDDMCAAVGVDPRAVLQSFSEHGEQTTGAQ